MTPTEFAFLARFLKERSGIVIGEDKRYLVESRLGPIARKAGFASLSELTQRLMRGGDTALAQSVIEAMTTNETFFFRDGAPFTQFSDVLLPEFAKTRAAQKRVRIWCAACSTGQEPYSLAMLLDEKAAQFPGWRFEIVATDLASEVVDRARTGLFSQFEVQRGLPIKLLLKHFTQEGDRWRIAAKLRERVQFRTLNLLRDFSPLGQFDVVFCRNVLIYFDEPTKADILGRIGKQLAPDGALLLGSAETVLGLNAAFRPHPSHRGLFVPAAAGAAPSAFRLASAVR
ncbi:CheR family methyltransferase [Methylopila turkensis]|uniref:protein-glutamate O-methyltransferase n=1 Tax=Methylopila turkensis TaxID=1437816 RepID=A0A9W6JMU6_9HYPH|nr:protein-glutamate O-methyltransferase CheR [Methylopila turkensis]GLK78589.1 chemotaxis protein methyltransferase [Methylopila turkensis]